MIQRTPPSIWSAGWKTGVPRNAPVFSLPNETPPQYADRGPEGMRYQGTPWKFMKRSGNGYSDSGLTKSAAKKKPFIVRMEGLNDASSASPVKYILIGAAAIAALCLFRKK